MEAIRLEFEHILADHLHANRVYRQHSFFGRMDKIVALLLFAYSIMLTVSGGVGWWTVVLPILALLEWYDLLSISPLQVYVAFKCNPNFKEKYSLEFSDEEIAFKTGSIDSRIKWTHYNKTLESNKVFILIYGRNMYTVIPKSAFGSRDDIEKFRLMIEKTIHSP